MRLYPVQQTLSARIKQLLKYQVLVDIMIMMLT
jgi:hypothetical protein